MLQAIFGLAGVVVGVVITAGIQACSAWRAEQRALRVAARLVYAELSVFAGQLAAVQRAQSLQPLDGPRRLGEVWAENRRSLATIAPEAWPVIAMGVRDDTWVPLLKGDAWTDGIRETTRQQYVVSLDAMGLLSVLEDLPLHPGWKRYKATMSFRTIAETVRVKHETDLLAMYEERYATDEPQPAYPADEA